MGPDENPAAARRVCTRVAVMYPGCMAKVADVGGPGASACVPDLACGMALPSLDDALLLRLMRDVSEHGATAAGGVHRPALTAADGQARDWLREVWRAAGLRVLVDPAGNMFGVLDWAGPDAPAVMTGSHLDSQPNGGRFDGAYGVVAACAAADALRRHARAEGVTPRRNLVIANWTNEEGARFQPSLLGSAAYTGAASLPHALARRDAGGVSVADALAAIGYAGADALPFPAAYVELHVECGPLLEAAGLRFGVFTRYWGAVKYRVAMLGEQAHTGPTPMRDRQDALLAAAYLIAEVRALADRAGGALHSSVGRLEVTPNSPNVVPGEAVLFIELRSAEPALLHEAEAALADLVPACAERAGVRGAVRAIDRRPAGIMDPGLVALAERCAAGRGEAALRLDTVAGHDAVSLAAVCPAVVIGVPSAGGICHHPSEHTAPDDLCLGAQLLADMLWRLAA